MYARSRESPLSDNPHTTTVVLRRCGRLSFDTLLLLSCVFRLVAGNLGTAPHHTRPCGHVQTRYRQRYLDLMTNDETRRVFQVCEGGAAQGDSQAKQTGQTLGWLLVVSVLELFLLFSTRDVDVFELCLNVVMPERLA